MAWRTITRKELRGLARPRRVKAGLELVVLVFIVMGYILPMNTSNPTTADYAVSMLSVVTLVLPLFGLLLGYKTIVEEREFGQMNLLLSLPLSRRGTVFGKFVGRASVLAAIVALGVLIGSGLVAYPFGSFDAGVMLGFLGVTFLFGVAFLGIGMAISTLTRSGRLATTATFGIFFLFVVIWGQLRTALQFGLDYLGLADGGLPDWGLFVYGLNPTMLYERAVNGIFGEVTSGTYLGANAPWYLGEWVALVALAVWAVGPAAIGYLRFRRTDL